MILLKGLEHVCTDIPLVGEVKSRAYPAPEHTYPIPKTELTELERVINDA